MHSSSSARPLRFDLVQMVNLNGASGRPNDDRAGLSTDLAWVVDGATDLGPPGLLGSVGGAAWLASAADRAFAAAPKTGIQATCDAVFAAIESRFDQDRQRDIAAAWELPKAAFAAVQLVGDRFEAAWAADCAILHATPTGPHWCTGAPDTGDEAADAAALGSGVGAEALRNEAVLADRRAHRGDADHVALSPSAAASARATRTASGPVSAGDDVVLMSDGFLRVLTDYHQYTAETLVPAIRAEGLAALAAELRAIEAEDAACLRYPRFKVSDDATALWLRVAE